MKSFAILAVCLLALGARASDDPNVKLPGVIDLSEWGRCWATLPG